jgi:hypothetical protein
MSKPRAPELTTKQIEKYILDVLKGGYTGYSYKTVWDRVVGIHFRRSFENTQRFQHALQSLAKRGRIFYDNRWYSLRQNGAQQAQATGFSREFTSS